MIARAYAPRSRHPQGGRASARGQRSARSGRDDLGQALGGRESGKLGRRRASAPRRARSLRTGSPASQRAAKHRMTKWRSTRPSSSRTITSRWPASATGSMSSAVSSRTSRMTASIKLSRRLRPRRPASVEAERRLARAPHDQHLAVADDGGADREEGPLGIGSCVSHAQSSASSVDRPTACGDAAAVTSSVSPLMTAPARAISGLSHAARHCRASAAVVSGVRSAVMAPRGRLQHDGHRGGQRVEARRARSGRRPRRRRWRVSRSVKREAAKCSR